MLVGRLIANRPKQGGYFYAVKNYVEKNKKFFVQNLSFFKKIWYD
jgi:uncharacterized protein YozE (UPF0346 family)